MQEIGLKKAALYNAIAKYGSMLVQLGVTMLLSRLILPEAFGVVAITSVLLGFLNLFADLGLGISIIQHPEMPKVNNDRLFSFSIIIGLVLAAITILAAFPLTAIYNEPLYKELCLILSIVSFLQAANVVPSSILMRDKRFKAIAVRTIVSSFISGVIAIILAWKEFGVYALIIQSIISYAVLFIWNYCDVHLSLARFNTRTIAGILGAYSLYQVLFNFINFFTRNLDNLVIGKYFGPAPLAQYNKSYMLYLYPNNLFSAVLTGVLHPYIREYKNDYGAMFNKYLQIEKVLSLIGAFTMITFFACSHEIIYIMFGSNWQPAGVYLRCLSLCMWTQMMSATSGSIFLGLERTDQIFKCGIINLILLLASISCGVWFNSLLILSLCVSASYNLIFLITNYILIKKTMNISLRKFLAPFVWDGFFVFGFVVLIYYLPEVSANIFISLIIKTLICTLAYSLFLSFTKQWKTILSLKGMIS
jgi:PST family polysaccharide transporter